MAASGAATDALTIEGDDLRWYSPDDDHNVAYGFCSNCGSTMFWFAGVSDNTNTTTSICAGSIDGRSGLSTIEVWFADDAADHVRLDPSIPRYGRNGGALGAESAGADDTPQ